MQQGSHLGVRVRALAWSVLTAPLHAQGPAQGCTTTRSCPRGTQKPVSPGYWYRSTGISLWGLCHLFRSTPGWKRQAQREQSATQGARPEQGSVPEVERGMAQMAVVVKCDLEPARPI